MFIEKLDVCVDAGNFPSLVVFPCTVQLRIHGAYWSEEQFLKNAVQVKHPLDVELAVPRELRDAQAFNLQNSDHEVAAHRAKFWAKWVNRAKQLAADEKALKESMEPHVSEAVAGKRILLFKEMLVSTGFPDLDVIDELRFGSDLTGQVPATGMLPGKFVPALSTVAELQKHAAMVRQMLDCESMVSGDPDIDAAVWTKTLENSKGWLEGPLQSDQVPSDQPISRRFGLFKKRGQIR